MGYCYKGMKLPSYVPLPRFLLQMDLSMNAKMIYALLLGRSNISSSERNYEKWSDERGAVFVVYPIATLAEHIGRGLSTVKNSLQELEKAGLVERKRMGMGKPNHIYVLMPDDEGYFFDQWKDDFYLSASQNSNCYDSCIGDRHESQNVSTIRKNDKNNRNTKREDKMCFGCYENVLLSNKEYEKLKQAYPLVLDDFIERLSVYKKSSGKKYADDGATLVTWINRNNSSVKSARSYDCEEEECLL